MTRENYLLSVNINDSYPRSDNWSDYRNKLEKEILPVFIESLMTVSDGEDDSFTLHRLLKAVSSATKTHDMCSTVTSRLTDIVCDHFVRYDHSEQQQQPDQSSFEYKNVDDDDDQEEKDDAKEEEKEQDSNFKFDLKKIYSDDNNGMIINVLNTPIVWKRLLNEKMFDIFVFLMKRYIKQIDLIKLSENNLIDRSNFYNHSKYYPSYKIPNKLNTKDCHHPIYGFFAATCTWGVKRRDYEKYKEYMSQMFWSIMYPNMTTFKEFYLNNDNSMTNMNETFSLFEYIYNNIDIVTQARFYTSSDIWIQPLSLQSSLESPSQSKCHCCVTACDFNKNNLNEFYEFVTFTMHKSLSSRSKRKAKCILIKKFYQRKDNLNIKAYQFQQWIDDFDCKEFIENCKEFVLMAAVFLIYLIITLICCPCMCVYWIKECTNKDDTTHYIEVAMRNQKQAEDQRKKILLLGSGSVGKSTLFKQIKDINPYCDEVERQKSEKASAKEEAKNVIRMNLIAEMATLIARAVMYHHDHPQLYTAPTYPEAYEVPDVNAPNGRYIVNIKEASETVVNLSKDAFSDVTSQNEDGGNNVQENEEYWIVLGVYIYALWQQEWIKEIYHKRRGLFSLSDNIDYFFDKARICMAPNFTVSDEDYLKVRVRTTGVIQHQFPYQATIVSNKDGYNTYKSFTITVTDTGGERNERKKWIHSFDTIATLLFVSSLNHCFLVLFEEETKNAMWESLDLFHDTLDGKWFRNTPVVVLLNHEDLFRESVLGGFKLRDCFDADEETHPNAEWYNAYDVSKSKYDDIEWEIDREFEATNERTKEEVADLYFEDVIHTQIDFISDLFFDIGEQHGRIRNTNIYVHVTVGTDTDMLKKQFDVILNHACVGTMFPVTFDAL